MSELAEMTSILPSLRTALSSFISSPSTFRLISSTSPTAPPPKTLFILDSSFNPPTKAHLHIALSSFHDASTGPTEQKRLLLLLATKNADKAPTPAPFDERLAMMSLFASDLLSAAPADAVVDIAVTKHARFVDKSEELARHYTEAQEQVYLTGFDTLVRILDTRYYPEGSLEPLDAFFQRGRVWCMFRAGDEWGGREAQLGFLKGVKRGEGGCRREWGERLRFLEGVEGKVSSTRVREAARRGEGEVVGWLVTEGVRGWVLGRKLYTQDGGGR